MTVHGTGYWFFRNQDFNALDRYTPQDPRDPISAICGRKKPGIRQVAVSAVQS